jgi:release factor glutamine methyltransferase
VTVVTVVETDPLGAASALLAAAGVPSPRVDAELLAAHVLGVPRGRLALAQWSPTAAAQFETLVSRRAARVPVQYLTGVAGFRRIELSVGPGVFIPRPESECLAGWALATLPGLGPAPLVVDLCAGSGAIALAIADEFPAALVHAVEADDAAFEWLARNTAGTAVRAHHCDLAGLGPLAGTVALVTANPPYLPADLAGVVEPEVRDYEPAAALWVAGDGLAVVRRVVDRAAELLRPGGRLAVEHADDQQEPVLSLVRGRGWADATGHPDLAGRPRFVTARWPG